MITGNINDFEKYCSINKHFKEALCVLKALSNGEDIDSVLTVNMLEVQTSDSDKNGNAKMFEAHKRFIDLHYIIFGNEQFGYANIRELDAETDYNDKEDYILLKGEASRITLHKGDFAIVFPEDAHIPAMVYKKKETVKRAVIKIPVQ